MKKCKHCGKQVSADHYCQSAKAVVPFSGSDSLVDAVAEVIGGIFDCLVDIDFS